MTVQDLINILQKIPNKQLPVYIDQEYTPPEELKEIVVMPDTNFKNQFVIPKRIQLQI